MTPEEWGPISALLENLWKDEFDQARESAYWRALREFNAEHVDQAVEAIAGNRTLAKHRVSAGGTYLPSAQMIAVEATEWAKIGTWQWASGVIQGWLAEARDHYAREHGTIRLPDEFFDHHAVRLTLASAVVAARGEQWTEKVLAFVDTFGLEYLAVHSGGSHYEREGRRRWAELTLTLDAGSGTFTQLPRRTP